jgi:hypothetical protein
MSRTVDPVSVSSGPYCHVCPPLLMGMFDGTVSLSLSLNLSASEESNQPSIQSNESSSVIAIENQSQASSPSFWIPTLEPNQPAHSDTSVPTITRSAADQTPGPTHRSAREETPNPTQSPLLMRRHLILPKIHLPKKQKVQRAQSFLQATLPRNPQLIARG